MKRNVVFIVVFVAVATFCQFYGLRWKEAAVCGLFAGLAGVGAWIVVVEDALNPNKRGG